jgi:hypothetical protein
MAFSKNSQYKDQFRVSIKGSIGSFKMDDTTVKEVILGESILNPSVQTAITFNRYLYTPVQSLDTMKGEKLNLTLSSSLTQSFGASGLNMTVNNTVYRLDNRRLISQSPSAVEEFTIHACDESLLEDAKHLMSKSWKCVTPNEIVNAALDCVKHQGSREISQCEPQRDYIAENIHPFRVIAQQANMALDGDDPSFVHFMTYENGGQTKHNFKSLKELINQGSSMTYYYSEGGETDSTSSTTPANPYPIMITFPCDFDYLTDLLNGVNKSGQNINTGTFLNLVNMGMNFLGQGGGGAVQGIAGGLNGCFEGGNMKQSWTNKGNSHQDYGCETDVERYLLKRQARMALLDRDKVALRMVTAWNPYMHVGQVIELKWENKQDGGLVYGSGQYLVTELMHKVQLGGYSTTTMDCVSKDVLQGVMN